MCVALYTMVECTVPRSHECITTVEIHTPYEVTVTAKTSKGAGVSSSCVFFTEEGSEHITYICMYHCD